MYSKRDSPRLRLFPNQRPCRWRHKPLLRTLPEQLKRLRSSRVSILEYPLPSLQTRMFKSSKQGPREQRPNMRRAHFPHAAVSLNYKIYSELGRAKDGWAPKGRSFRVGIPGGFVICSKVRGKDRREQRLNVRRAHFPHAAISPNYKTHSELRRAKDGWGQKGEASGSAFPGAS